jgi:hypothetical protein
MKKVEFNSDEVKFLKENLKLILENSFFKGKWEEFEQFSTLPKKEFNKQLAILRNIMEKLK